LKPLSSEQLAERVKEENKKMKQCAERERVEGDNEGARG